MPNSQITPRFKLVSGKITITAPTATTDVQSETVLDHIAWHRIEEVFQTEVKRVSRLIFNDAGALQGQIEL